MEEEKHFKCISCKINKPISQYHKKPNIRYHYHDCKDCNVKDHIKELVILNKIAKKQNKTYNQVLQGLNADPTSDEYDNIMIDYIPLYSDINNDNINNEGETLHIILFDLFKKLDKQI
jgi:hypothetical protein